MKKVLLFLSLIFLVVSSAFSQLRVGAESELERLPVYAYFGFSYSQTIYQAHQINASGDITSIVYYARPGINLSASNYWKVYVGHTSQSVFANNAWIDIDSLVLAFDGNISVVGDSVTIVFNQPFTYNGVDNLVIAVDENQPGYNQYADRFYCSSSADTVSIIYYSDNTNPNPDNPPSPPAPPYPNRYKWYPNITFVGITSSCSADGIANLSTGEMSDTSAVLQWDGNFSSYSVNVTLEGQPFDQGMEYTTTSNFVLADGLSSSTKYNFSVRGICGPGDTSAWVGNYTFETECGPVMPFELDEFPGFRVESNGSIVQDPCWEKRRSFITNVVGDTVQFGDETYSSWSPDLFGNISGGSPCARLNIFGTSIREWLISNVYDLGEAPNNYQLEFDLALTIYNNPNPAYVIGDDDRFVLLISEDNGATWTTSNILRSWDSNDTIGLNDHISIDLSSYSGYVKFAFYGESTQNNVDIDVLIDNFVVSKCNTVIQSNDTVCGIYTSVLGNVYTSSGTYRDTIVGATCDSIFEVELVVDSLLMADSLTITTCNPFVAPSGNVYTTSGVYIDTVFSSSPTCDSLYVINLQVNSPITNPTNETACDTFVSVNGNVYTETGVYSDTLTGSNMCDSIIQVNLYIPNIDVTVTQNDSLLSVNETDSSAAYQWVDCNENNSPIAGQSNASFIATESGSYACFISASGCQRLTDCIEVTIDSVPNPNDTTTNDSTIFVHEFLTSDILIFPNPNDGSFNLELKQEPNGQAVVTVSNTLGQVVYVNQDVKRSQPIHLPSNSKGIFILDVRLNNQSIKKRILVK